MHYIIATPDWLREHKVFTHMNRYGCISPLVKIVVVRFVDLGLVWPRRSKKGVCGSLCVISRCPERTH